MGKYDFNALSQFGQEIFDYIRIIQRFSATRLFRTKFTTETQPVFSWTTILIQSFMQYGFDSEHFYEIDLLELASVAFYVSFAFLIFSFYKPICYVIIALISEIVLIALGFTMAIFPTRIFCYVVVYINCEFKATNILEVF